MEIRKPQVVHMDRAVAESVRDLVNPPVSQLPELSLEAVVTTGELDMLIGSAQRVLKEEPVVNTQLPNGDKVTVTRFSAPFRLDEKSHYVRFMQYQGGKKSDDVYVLFDMSESAEHIMVRDPNVFRLESGDNNVRGVYVHTGVDLPDLNNRGQVSFAQWALMEIVEAGEKHKAEQAEAAVTEQQMRDQQKQQARRDRSLRWSRRWRNLEYHAPEVMAGTALMGLLTLFGFAVANIDDPIEEFDKHHYELDGGANAPIGGQPAAPEFSFELLHGEHLETTDIPEIGNIDDAAGPVIEGGTDHDDRIKIDELRQVRIPTNDKDKACETAHVEFDSPDDTVRLWTDYQGNPQDFSVTVGNDTLQVCWNGPELKDNEMPRVVAKRQPADVPGQQQAR